VGARTLDGDVLADRRAAGVALSGLLAHFFLLQHLLCLLAVALRADRPRAAMKKVANRNVSDFGWKFRSRRRFTTPADSPLHDGSPYSHVHARRESLGFVHHSRSVFCRPVPNPSVTIHNLCIALCADRPFLGLIGRVGVR
jgi:hypothetical protein